MTEEELAAILGIGQQPVVATQPVDPREVIRKALTTDRATEPLPKTAQEMLDRLSAGVARPEDDITRGTILPLTKNERTGKVEFDPLNAGITGSVVDALTLPGRTAAGENLEATFETPEQAVTEEGLAQGDLAWKRFAEGATNMAGNITLGSGVMRLAEPSTLTMGIKLPSAVKTKMAAVKTGGPPDLFNVAEVDIHAPPELKSLEKPRDLYKTYYLDEKQVLGDLAERAGVPNIAGTRQLIDQDTQNTALMRVNEALRSGKLKTKFGQYEVKNPPELIYAKYKALPQQEQVDADQYLKLRDYSDDLKLRIARGIKATESTKELLTVQQSIQQIEERSPAVLELAEDYRNATEAVRGFLGSGPNAIFDSKALTALGQERPNYVPIDITGVNPNDNLLSRISDAQRALEKGADDWFVQARDLENINGIENRVNSFEILLDYTRNALQHKMENDVRGEFLREMANSTHGKETVRKLKPEEAGKYGDRVVTVYENGKKESYLSSKLQRDLLQFDPYIAKFPTLYTMKRLFEIGTTGPLSLTFAPTTMIRDALTGAALREKGLPAPGIIGTLSAIPEQVVPKFQRGAAEMLKTSLKNVPFIDETTTARLADNLSKRYANSFYALSNEVGGIDASLMKSTIETRRGIWREVMRSLDETGGQIPGARTLGHSLTTLAHGWDGLFSAISDAPRFSVFKKQVQQGVDPSTAAVNARRIAGDTSRSGKSYLANGQRVAADVKRKEFTAPAPLAAWTAAAAKEMLPYYNPAVQGMRRLATRFVADPVRTQLNAWKYVGLPALAAYGWNEMMGQEYNDYAQQHRSERDMAMNIYVAVPGLPPEQGIEIPIGHEMMPWVAPWSTALYNIGRGDEDVAKGLMHSGANILKNASMIGYPQFMAGTLNLSGYQAPQSILTPLDDTYQMREDNVGFLPENVEKLARTMFGSISDMALMSSAAAYDGGPEAFFDELGWQVGKRTPIVKNLIGSKTAVTAFTPKSEELHNKMDAYYKFIDTWEQHFGDNAQLLDETLTKPTENLSIFGKEDPTKHKLGPNLTPVPTNPVFKHFGDMIKSTIGTNDEGFSALKDRYNLMGKQIRLLRGYTAGRKTEFAEFQKVLKNAPKQLDVAMAEYEANKGTMNKKEQKKALKNINLTYGEAAKAAKLIDDQNIDLSNRSDVMKLINYLEMERFKLMNEQVVLIKQLEDRISEELHQQGMLPKDVRFSVEKHLSPTVPSDFLQ